MIVYSEGESFRPLHLDRAITQGNEKASASWSFSLERYDATGYFTSGSPEMQTNIANKPVTLQDQTSLFRGSRVVGQRIFLYPQTPDALLDQAAGLLKGAERFYSHRIELSAQLE